MFHKRRITFILLLVLHAGWLMGQNGPGGVENNNGSSSLFFWLRADSLHLNGSDIDTLYDLSGYNNHFVQPGLAHQPFYNSTDGNLNAMPSIDFDGNGEYLLNENGDALFNNTSGYTLFYVIQSDDASSDNGWFITDYPKGSDGLLSVRYDQTGSQSGNSNLITAGTGAGDIIETSAGSQSTNPQIITYKWSSGVVPSFFIDGDAEGLSYGSPVIGSITGADSIIVGKGAMDISGTDGWDGRIAEVIYFNRELNTAEQTIVENYLNARYDLSLVNDVYSSASYVYNVAGIGHEADGEHNRSFSAGFGLREDNSTLETDGEYILFGHDNKTNDIASVNTGAEITNNLGTDAAAWNRDWYVEQTAGTDVDLKVIFDFDEGIEGGGIPQNISNYRLIYRPGTSGDYAVVNSINTGIQNGDQVYFEIDASDINDGYYTLATVDQTNSPVEGSSAQTWYTLVGGNWTNSDIWTLDPSGALPNNPDSEVPDANDNVVILSGKTVTVTENGKQTQSIEVNGRLDLGTTSGHDFTEIRGEGKMILRDDNFPAGDATHFTSEGLGEGTVVFEGGNYDLTTPHTFYKVEIDLDNPTDWLSLEADYQVDGDLTINNGIFRINDNSTTAISLLVNGTTTVTSGTQFTVGTGNVVHDVEFTGDVTNNGTIDFANDAQYSCASSGAVKVSFTGAANNTLTCNGTTDFYRMFVDKGTDETYTLSVVSTDPANFRLFGPISGGSCIDPADGPGGWERLALVLYHGTLKLGSNIDIPRLGENRDGDSPNEFHIPYGARLWIDGADVATSNAGGGWRGLTLYGTLKITEGTFTNPANTGGITYFSNVGSPGKVVISGGEIYTTQLKQADASGRFSYIQSGGSVYINALSDSRGSSAVFALPNADHTFEMSGGLVQIEAVNTTATNGIHILSAEGNYNVTGGDFEVLLPTLDAAGESQFEVNSTAPLYNLTLTESANPNSQTLVLQDNLTILNDLTIGANTEFDADGNDLSIGGDFNLEDGGVFTHGNNTTRFFGEQNSTINIGNTVTAGVLDFNNLLIEKDQRSNPLEYYTVEVIGGITTDRPIDILDSLTIIRGQLDVNGSEVDVQGDISITDGGVIATDPAPGHVVMNGSAQQTLQGSLVYSPNFGRIELDNGNGAAISTDITMDYLMMADGILDIDQYQLTIDTSLVEPIGAGFSDTKMIKTSGQASDGGLRFKFDVNDFTAGDVIDYPVGCYVTGAGQDEYMQSSLIFRNTIGVSDEGYFTIIPVDGEHPANNGGLFPILDFYWKTKAEEFNSNHIDQVYFRFYNYENLTSGWFSPPWYGYFNNGDDWLTDDDGFSGTNIIRFNDLNDDLGLISGDFTAAQTLFGLPFLFVETYYSRNGGGDWNNGNTWSIDSHSGGAAGSIPTDFDIVIIGDNDSVYIVDNGMEASQIYVRDGSVLDIGVTNSHNFTDVFGAGKVRFGGNIQPTIPNTNFDEFLNNDTAIVEFYGSVNYTIPNDFNVYPNLLITGGTNITLPTQDILVRKNLTVDDSRLRFNNNGDDLIILDSLICRNSGEMLFNRTQSELTVYKSIDLTRGTGSNRILTRAGGTYANPNKLNIYENIDLNSSSSIDLFRTNTEATTDIYFLGNNNSEINDPGGANLDFNRLVINKAVNTSNVDILESFSLNGATDGLSSEKALYLQSGDLTIDNGATNIDLTTGGGDFRIPSETSLTVLNGTVNASGSNTGIFLDGLMVVGDGSNWRLNQGTNNYIEYSSSGNAQIDVHNGVLRVGSQIRRSLNTNQGILKFHQLDAGSTVSVGEVDAPEGNRGVFEILNSGSEFTQVDDANITIVRQQATPSVAALLFEPENVSIGTGASFTFGDDANTPADQVMGINSSVNLKNIVVNETNTPTVQSQIRSLTLEEDLTIENGSAFDANGLDLDIEGDFLNAGDFISNGNTTTFNGTNDQTIAGKTTFYNLTKSTANTLGIHQSLTDSIYVENNLRVENGTIADSSNAIIVQADLLMDGTHVYGGTGNGIEMDGNVQQEMSGNGTLGMFTVSNPYGVRVLAGNEITITDGLNLNGGVLDVGSNLLTLGVNAEIIEGAGFGSNNMIQTNSSFTDNGVRKIFESTADAGGAYDYKIPIGSGNKYTPVEYKITSNNNSTGAIITKAADEMHPSITDDTEDPEIFDPDYVLQYHWVIKSEGISGFSADVEMTYNEADVSIQAPYDITDYITARLLNDGSGNWNKYNTADFDEANQLLTFTFDGVGDDQIEGDYTAGIDDAIPDQVPFYETNQSGDWTDGSIWTPNIPGGPRGAMVRINTGHTVSMPSNFQSSYVTTINGRLEVNTTFGHRLGEVDGTGTLYTQRASLPAGYYEEFFSSAGGTLEYGGADSYDVLSTFSQVNNLVFSGTGERRFPNQEITILGDFTMNGDDAALETINDHDKRIIIEGDIDFLTGSFDAGIGPNAIVEMAGSSLQTITGDFTGSNAFYSFEIDNANNVDLAGNIEIENELLFSDGIINTSASSMLTISNSSVNAVIGADQNSYVNGPMRKLIIDGNNFTFPVGDGDRYGELNLISTDVTGSDYWEAEYYDETPDNNPSLNTADFEATLEKVSEYEYWRINGPGSGTARNRIRWDNYSILPAETDDRPNNLKMVEWITANAQWEIVDPSTVVDNGINDGTITSDNNLNLDGDHYFTFGTTEADPLPTAGFLTQDTTICSGSTVTLRVEVTGDADYSIDVDDGSGTNTYTGSSSPITFNVTPGATTTYTVTEVTEDTDGSDGGPVSSTTTIFGDPVTITVDPLPAAFNLIGGGQACSGDSVELLLDDSELNVNYELFRNSAYTGITVGGTGDTISFGYFTDVSQSGSYEAVAVSSSGNCTQNMTGTQTVTITQRPDPEPYVDASPVCWDNGINVPLYSNDTTGLGDTYLWSPAADLDDDQAAVPNYQPSNPNAVGDTTMFEVTVTESTYGCFATDSVEVIILRKPQTGNQYYVPNEFDQ